MRATRIGAALLSSLLVSSAFGGSAGATVSGAKTVSASKWVKAVCAAETKIKSAAASKFDTLNAAAKAGDVEAAKAAFVSLIGALPGPSKTLLLSLKKAGVPKIRNGKQIAKTYVTALKDIQKALPGIKTQAEALPTSDLDTLKTAARATNAPIESVTKAANAKVGTLDGTGKVAPALGACGGVFAVGGGSEGGGQNGDGQNAGEQPGGTAPPPAAPGG
jgi:hypothetical protein